MNNILDHDAKRIRRNLTLGCAGLIAMPYTLGLSLLGGAPGWVGLLLLTIAAVLAALGLKEIQTIWSWLTFGSCLTIAVCALLAAFTTGSERAYSDLAWSYVIAIGLGPAMVGIFGGILLATERLIASTALMLLGGALSLFGTWMALEHGDRGDAALPVVLLGFGLSMTGPVLLTFRPLPDKERVS